MRNIYNSFGGARSAAFLLICLLFAPSLFAFPNQEKAVLNLVSSQASSFVIHGDGELIQSSGSSITLIDLDAFALASAQVPALVDNSSTDGGVNLTGDITGLTISSNTLYAAQADGDFLTINLNDPSAQPTSTHVIDGALGGVVADTEGGGDDDKLYFADKANNALVAWDLGDQKAVSISLTDSLGQPVTPGPVVFASFPTAASSSSVDKIFVLSGKGLLFVVNEGGTSVAQTVSLSTASSDLVAAALTPDRNFLLVVNATDNTVHVIDTSSNAEMDTDPLTSGTNPISLSPNGTPKGIVIADVSNPSDVYAYVSGSGGLSVIDLNLGSTGAFNQPTVIDFDDTGSSDSSDNPLALSSIPGSLAASSSSDGMIYASDSNAGISVVSEKPFISNLSTSLGSGPLTVNGTFTVTFRSDEVGTYRVLVGGDRTGSGHELTTGTVDAADTDVTTASISYDGSLFAEGANRLFAFVTDADGNIGRRAFDVTVDTPPPAIEITKTNFGNEKIYITFKRLTQNDIDHYNVYVATDAAQAATATEAAGTLTQPGSGETIEAKIVGLINDTTYFVGVEGVDATGNVGPRTTTLSDGSPATATPERTIGLAGVTGEAGCGLVPGGHSASWLGILWMLGVGVMLVTARAAPFGVARLKGRRRKVRPYVLIGMMFILVPSSLHAGDKTPQWFSLEFKGGVWMPLNGTTRDLLGTMSPTGMAEFGFLYHSKYGAEVGVGYIGAGGSAVGLTSGATSADRFDFTIVPIWNNFTFRADFKEDQLLVPYAKVGPDYWFFRENVQGAVTKGIKYGFHGALGLQINLDRIEDLSETMEKALGVNDVYFVVEGRYNWVSSFGARGVDLSSLTLNGGLLFEF